MNNFLKKRIVIAIIICAGLTESTTYAGTCRVKDPDVAGFYSGQCVEGVAHGKGIAKGRDTYIGEFKNGGAHGFGVNTWGAGTEWAGDIYVGEWINDERTGNDLYIVKGKYSTEGKDITHSGTCRVKDLGISGSYVGECVSGVAHGKGVAKGKNVYMGYFKNGNKHGKGAYIWGTDSKIAGAVLIGESIDDKISQGLLISNSGETIAVENNLQTRIDEISIKSEAESKAFKLLLTSGTPEELYLAGVKSETESDYDRASTLYNQVISRFSKAPVALKAADRLLAIKDKLDMQKRDSDSQAKAQRDAEKRRIEESDADFRRSQDKFQQTISDIESASQQERQMNQQKDQNRRLCEAQKQTCLASCRPNDSSCSSGCRRISCW
ncbi:MAG: hypothetical protein PHN84_02160 [Desulfuromonadaceae bacterium]|nr:hypothetical protein [Desulfuromonadaceae bacterium]MDD2855128.1 hypothetical protein [Desulfuromonadaceae bacterium]